jgi:transcriptional regulator with XRE-family HTH domain
MVRSANKPDWAVRAERLMKQHGLIQEDLLDAFGVTTRGAVGHYFRGRSHASIEHLEALAKLLDSSTEYLLTGKQADVDETLIREAVTKQLSAAIDINWLTLREDIPLQVLVDLILKDYCNLMVNKQKQVVNQN